MCLKKSVLLFLVFGLSVTACTIHDLRSNWTTRICPQHNVKLRKAIVRTEAAGYSGVPRREGAVDYTRINMPQSTGNAKLDYLEATCIERRFDYAKIYFCAQCQREYQVAIKEEKKAYLAEQKFERSDSARGLALLACLDYLASQKYCDSAPADSIYILKNRFTNNKEISSSPDLKGRILSDGELKRRGITNYIKVIEVDYPPRRWGWHKIFITYTVYPNNVTIFNNFEWSNSEWKLVHHRIKSWGTVKN